jgi:hypothetical protein
MKAFGLTDLLKKRMVALLDTTLPLIGSLLTLGPVLLQILLSDALYLRPNFASWTLVS